MSDALTHRLSGGVGPMAKEYLVVRKMLQGEPDVLLVYGLSCIPGFKTNSWVYLIQTPFATWPKYVVGILKIKDELSISGSHVISRHAFRAEAEESYHQHNSGLHRCDPLSGAPQS